VLAGLAAELNLPSAAAQTTSASSSASFAVAIEVDVAKTIGPLHPIWRFFGADEPNYACMKDGKKLLAELGKIGPGNAFFRTHNLLTTGDGTPALKWGSTNAYTEDANGKPVYNWTIVDRIFDTYLERSVRPYVQIGFMPKALSIKPDPYQHRWTPARAVAIDGSGRNTLLSIRSEPGRHCLVPGNDPQARAYQPQIFPKWMAPDGQVVSQARQVRQRSRCRRVLAVGATPSSTCLMR